MIETKNKKIDGIEVTVTQFPARKGFLLQAKLVRIIGPVFGEFISGLSNDEKDVKDKEFDLSKFGSAIEKLFRNLSEEQALDLITEILQGTRIDGQEIDDNVFNATFSGEYMTLYKVIGYALEVNFKSFFVKSGIGKMFKGTKIPV